MTDVIDLNGERNKRAQPDAEFICQDAFGRPMYTFSATYEHSGKQWALDFWAYDAADAEAKVHAIKESLELFGQAFRKDPA